jgi:hypothetical protein
MLIHVLKIVQNLVLLVVFYKQKTLNTFRIIYFNSEFLCYNTSYCRGTFHDSIHKRFACSRPVEVKSGPH